MVELSPEQRLALVFGRNDLRVPHSTLLLFDAFLAKTVRLAREPLLGQMRLGWWREQIQLLPLARPGPDPLLVSLDGLVRFNHVTTTDLIALVNAWETLLGETPSVDGSMTTVASERGSAVFRLASAIAGTTYTDVSDRAGRLWALVDFARNNPDTGHARFALDLAAQLVGAARALPIEMRPYAVLTRFAERDAMCGLDGLTPSGSPRRILQAWRIALGLP